MIRQARTLGPRILTVLLLVLGTGWSPRLEAREVFFSGVWWQVRSTDGGGPGNGCFSDEPASVWVDASGQLHLKIRQVAGQWCQAEVVSQTHARFGDHKFFVISRLDQLDPDAVLGMFAYRDDTHEIDIEITDAFDSTPNRGWFIVQPATTGAGCVPGIDCLSFPFTMTGTFSTHTFRWLSSSLDFESWHGHCPSPPCGGPLGPEGGWTYGSTNAPDEADDLRTHINLWLCTAAWCSGDGVPSGDVEVILAAYQGSQDPIPQTLSVTKVGAGAVLSSPAGIDCGPDCSEAYDPGTLVTLSPFAFPGWSFSGWSGDADCSDGQVTLSASRSCVATFSPVQPDQSLSVSRTGDGLGTVTSTPAGIDCGLDCGHSYPYGTEVSLTATPEPGSVFTGWSGDADCSNGRVTLTQPLTCIATFGRSAFRCDHIDLAGDSDGDGVFESGEQGNFVASLCNDGDAGAQFVRGILELPAPLGGEWRDDDAPFPNLSPTECQHSEDDFSLRVPRDRCGGGFFPMTVEFDQGNRQTGVPCPFTVQCAPYIALQNELDGGVVEAGTPLTVQIQVSNTGSTALNLTAVTETSGAPDVTVDSFPATLNSGEIGMIQVSVNTSMLAPGSYARIFQAASDANNLTPQTSTLFFGISGGSAPRQLTTSPIDSGVADVSEGKAVFLRGFDVYVLDLQSGTETRLTETAAREYSPRISGDRVVYARDDGDPAYADIFLFDLATGLETRLTDHPGKQVDPDISGDTVVWQDDRSGPTSGDIYTYTIGVSPINGTPLVDLGAPDLAAQDPRIEERYLGYFILDYEQPGNPASFFRRDLGYLDRASGARFTAQVLDQSPCTAGNRFDLFGRYLAFECDDASDTERDDLIYYVDMDTRSAPVRLTCNAALGANREEPLVLANRVLYVFDGTRDIYSAALPGACQPEIPLHVGAHALVSPAGDPRREAYVFHDNRDGPWQLWGVVPPPAVDLAVTGFFFDADELRQESSYPFHVLLRSEGSDVASGAVLSVTDGGTTVGTWTLPELAGGATLTIDGIWSTGSTATGPHTLVAALAPPAAGDGNASNDGRTLVVEVLDDDTQPPTLFNPQVAPGPTHDGDAYLEAGEDVTITWSAEDPSGVAQTRATLGVVTVPGLPLGGNRYQATFSSPGEGGFSALLDATDGDDSPATTSPPLPVAFTVYPAFPAVIARAPEDGDLDIPPDTAIEATFSVELDPTSLSVSTFVLRSSQGTSVSATLSLDPSNRVPRLQPLIPLESEGSYQATLAGGAAGLRDVRQNPLPADVVWSFTVADVRPPRVDWVGSVPDSGDGELVQGEVTATAITELLIHFDEGMLDLPGNGGNGDVNDPIAYMLVSDGGDGFDTVDCLTGPAPGDASVNFDSASYDSQARITSLALAGGTPLAEGRYRLFACGSLGDLAGNPLDGDADGSGGDDFVLTFSIDRTTPTPPVLQSPSHVPGSWSAARTVEVEWSGAADLHGIAGYSILFDRLPQTVPDTVIEISQQVEPIATTSPPLADGADHYVHLRACDPAGNCSAAVHLGPFWIDAAPPINPQVVSTSHTPGSWSSESQILLSWQGATDDGIGVSGYSWALDQAAGTVPDGVVETPQGTDPHTLSLPTVEGTGWTFHLSACDLLGDCSPPVHLGPFHIDLTPPTPPSGLMSTSHQVGIPSNNPQVQVQWAASTDALSGVAGYGWVFSGDADWSCDYVPDGDEAVLSATSPALGGGSWWFHLCANDLAGNWSDAIHLGPFLLDVQGPVIQALDSVADTGDGVLQDGEITGVSITQLVVTFDEAMDVATAEDPANWLLVRDGGDLILDTTSCLVGVNPADLVVSVTPELQADAQTIAVRINGTTGLGRGLVRMLACATLSDLLGNPLGADALMTFAVTTDNPIPNPNFDQDVLPWSGGGSQPGALRWDPSDGEGKVTSGSLALSTSSGAGATAEASQCLALSAGGSLQFLGLLEVVSDTASLPVVDLVLESFSDVGCTVPLATNAIEAAGATNGWAELTGRVPVAGAAGLRITFRATGGSADSWTVRMDRLRLVETLFADGFESGDFSAWSQVFP